MKVLSYQAHNVLRIDDIDFNLKGKHLFLVGGRNDNGKSSSLLALCSALCGRSGMEEYPEVLLKEGEDEGWVRVNLSGDEDLHEPEGFTVELNLARKRNGTVAEKFRILDSAGETAPSPRKLLNDLYHAKAFDPLSFARMKPKEQRDLLCKLVGVDPAEYDERCKVVYDARTEVNREGKSVRAQYDALEKFEDVPEEEIDVTGLTKDLQNAQAHNADYGVMQQRSAGLEGKLVSDKAEVERLKRRLAEAEATVASTEAAIVNVKNQMSSFQRADEQAIFEQINNASAINEKVRSNQKRNKLFHTLTALRDKSKAYGEKLQDIQNQRDLALEKAEWPVPGLGVDKEGPLYEGLPLSQAAKSHRVFVSTMIGIALKPKLRLMVCQDGSDLDSDTMGVLQSLLEQHDFQMLLEVVTHDEHDEDRCAVIIEDGRMKNADTSDREV